MNITTSMKHGIRIASLLSAIAGAAPLEAWGESSEPRRAARIAVPTGEDDRSPTVFERNLRSAADRTIALGAEVGLPAEILAHVAELQDALDTVGAAELGAAAELMGPHIARIRLAMERIVIVPAPILPADSLDDPADPRGPWEHESDLVKKKKDPTDYGIDVDTQATGTGNSSPKVCAEHQELGCEADEDCPEGETCIDRPAAPTATQQVVIVRGCAIRPIEAVLKALAETATDVEATKLVLNRICNQVVFGFNGSLACILPDLAFLTQERLLQSESTCKQLWAEAESRSSYSRLAILKELEDETKATADGIKEKADSIKGKADEIDGNMRTKFDEKTVQIDTFHSDTTAKFTAANTKIENTQNLLSADITSARAAILTDIAGSQTALNVNLDGSRTAVQSNVDTTRNAILSSLASIGSELDTNIDASRSSINTNVDGTRVALNTNIDSTRAALLALAGAQGELFVRAELERVLLHRERLALYYLPEAQGGKLGLLRQIVEETIARVEGSHETVNQARVLLGYAGSDITAGRFKRAFNYLSGAYFEAVKSVGDQQTY